MSGDVVKEGYVKVKSKHLGAWKKRWFKLRIELNGVPKRLEKYQDVAVAQIGGGERTTYELDYIRYVDRIKESRKKHAIHIILENFTSVQFALETEMEAQSWLTAIQEVAFGASGSFSNNVFEVYLMKSTQLQGASGECLLQVTADSISLLDIDNPQRVQLTWPLSSIRRYSVERGMFRIETGRSSPTGEGQFLFDTKQANDIYDKVRAALQTAAQFQQLSQLNSPLKDAAIQHYNAEQQSYRLDDHDVTASYTDMNRPPPYTAPGAPTHQKRRQQLADIQSVARTCTYIEPEIGMLVAPAPVARSGTGKLPTYTVPAPRQQRLHDDQCPEYNCTDWQSYSDATQQRAAPSDGERRTTMRGTTSAEGERPAAVQRTSPECSQLETETVIYDDARCAVRNEATERAVYSFATSSGYDDDLFIFS